MYPKISTFLAFYLLCMSFSWGQSIKNIKSIGTYTATKANIQHSYQIFSTEGLLLEEMQLLSYKDTTQKNFFTYQYNEQKKLASKQGYEKNTQNIIKINYRYEPKLLITSEIRGNDTLTQYNYWGKGNRKEVVLLEKRTILKSKMLEKIAYTYSPEDSLLSETISQRVGGKLKSKKIIHQYNPLNFQKTETREYDFNNALINQINYKYNSQNKLVEIRDYCCITQYVYQEDKLLSISHTNTKENSKKITYFEQEKPVKIQFYEGLNLAYSLKYEYTYY